MNNRMYENKSVIIIGATGGLGTGIARAFSGTGARLLLVGRNEEKLKEVKSRLPGDITLLTSDITDEKSIEEIAQFAKTWSSTTDIVINAAGYDVRKSLEDHSNEEIQQSLDLNLKAPVLISKAFLPMMKEIGESVIVHIGGFADGRMAFPYYSVDAATRSGLYTFIESTNRELQLEGSLTRLCYFCPSPAQTEAERPYHALWRKMGVSIVSIEKVAQALMKAITKKKTVSIMGGLSTVLFAKLNSVAPKLADAIVMKNYGKMLQSFFYGKMTDEGIKPGLKGRGFITKLAVVLVVLSFVFYGLIAVVPFIPLTFAQKAVAVPVLIAFGEITWWVGIALVGKQVVMKYRKYFNPCNWFSCNKKELKSQL